MSTTTCVRFIAQQWRPNLCQECFGVRASHATTDASTTNTSPRAALCSTSITPTPPTRIRARTSIAELQHTLSSGPSQWGRAYAPAPAPAVPVIDAEVKAQAQRRLGAILVRQGRRVSEGSSNNDDGVDSGDVDDDVKTADDERRPFLFTGDTETETGTTYYCDTKMTAARVEAAVMMEEAKEAKNPAPPLPPSMGPSLSLVRAPPVKITASNTTAPIATTSTNINNNNNITHGLLSDIASGSVRLRSLSPTQARTSSTARVVSTQEEIVWENSRRRRVREEKTREQFHNAQEDINALVQSVAACDATSDIATVVAVLERYAQLEATWPMNTAQKEILLGHSLTERCAVFAKALVCVDDLRASVTQVRGLREGLVQLGMKLQLKHARDALRVVVSACKSFQEQRDQWVGFVSRESIGDEFKAAERALKPLLGELFAHLQEVALVSYTHYLDLKRSVHNKSVRGLNSLLAFRDTSSTLSALAECGPLVEALIVMGLLDLSVNQYQATREQLVRATLIELGVAKDLIVFIISPYDEELFDFTAVARNIEEDRREFTEATRCAEVVELKSTARTRNAVATN